MQNLEPIYFEVLIDPWLAMEDNVLSAILIFWCPEHSI